MPLLRKRPLIAIATAALLASTAVSLALAQAPGPPDYYWPYGLVQADNANVSPAQQTVVGMVNGKVCGLGATLIATAGENVPASDVGKTVYHIDILADGTRSDQRPGCGKAGDPVVLYMPALHRIALQRPSFKAGGERVDLTLSTDLQFTVINPYTAKDGTQ